MRRCSPPVLLLPPALEALDFLEGRVDLVCAQPRAHVHLAHDDTVRCSSTPDVHNKTAGKKLTSPQTRMGSTCVSKDGGGGGGQAQSRKSTNVYRTSRARCASALYFRESVPSVLASTKMRGTTVVHGLRLNDRRMPKKHEFSLPGSTTTIGACVPYFYELISASETRNPPGGSFSIAGAHVPYFA